MALSAPAPALSAGTRQLLALLASSLLAGYGVLAGLRLAGGSPGIFGRATDELLALPGAVGWLACPLRTLTGIACPGCGATRAGLALLRFDLGAALHWNPFLVLALAALVAGGGVALLAPQLAERWLVPAGALWRSPRARWLLAAALLLASAWQTAHLPR